jgi:hypothetical protein
VNDEPLIVRVCTRGPLLGSRTVTPARFISAQESRDAYHAALRRKYVGIWGALGTAMVKTHGQGERTEPAPETPTMPPQQCSQPRYVPNGAERQSEANVRTARPYRAEVRTNVKAEGTG